MKKAILFITRFNSRTEYKQYVKSVTETDWKRSCVDAIVAEHGPEKTLSTVTALPRIDMRKKTDGRLVDLNRRLFQKAIDEGYKYVCIMDDDACFKGDVDLAMKPIIQEFEKRPKLGAAGFCQGRQLFWLARRDRSIKNDMFLPLKGHPWASFGFQMYRVKMLKTIPFDDMKNIILRNDMFMFMSAYLAGWELGYWATKEFVHQCSGAVANPSPEARMRSMEANRKNFDIFMRRFGHDPVLRKSLVIVARSTYRFLGVVPKETSDGYLEELKQLGKEVAKKGNSNAS